ncbi:MAG: aromatic ring-hydroxylating dioxygenase subunit alpha [Candidatus Sulfotelmatobacter sp.]
MPNPLESLQIDSDIARAWTLPSQLYTEPAVIAVEKEPIFARSWQVVGHRDQAAKPGDYFTTELVGEPLLIVRGADGKLRGFYNVCRHRAGPPAVGCGSRKLFRCGYHGWTYDLDGSLISATQIEGVEGFRREDFALVPVAVEEWFNLIFVNLDRNPPPLRESLGELPKQAERFHFAGMKLFERRTYDMKCNWKTYLDNYLEGYHLPSVHPGLNRELDYNAYAGDRVGGARDLSNRDPWNPRGSARQKPGLNFARDLRVALHDDAVGNFQNQQPEQQQAAPEMEIEFDDVDLISGPAIAETAARKHQHDQRRQQQDTACGRKFFENCPEEFLNHVQTVAARRESFRSLGGYVTRIEAIAGARFGFERSDAFTSSGQEDRL